MARIRTRREAPAGKSKMLLGIEQEQRWLLLAALSYNCDDDVLASDQVYDWSVANLLTTMNQNPTAWASSDVHPEVFQDPERAWAYTSQHFPTNQRVRGWLEAQWDVVAHFEGKLDGPEDKDQETLVICARRRMLARDAATTKVGSRRRTRTSVGRTTGDADTPKVGRKRRRTNASETD